MFKKHHKPVDHLLLALAALAEGDSKTATEQLAEAIADPEALDDALEDLNDSNEVALDLDMDDQDGDDDMDMDDEDDEEADYDGDDTEDDFPERTNSVASIMKRAKAQASSDGLDDEDADLEPDDDDMGGESDGDEDDMDMDDDGDEEDSDFDDIMDEDDGDATTSANGKHPSKGGSGKPKPKPSPGHKPGGAAHSSLSKITASVVARNEKNRKGLL